MSERKRGTKNINSDKMKRIVLNLRKFVIVINVVIN